MDKVSDLLKINPENPTKRKDNLIGSTCDKDTSISTLYSTILPPENDNRKRQQIRNQRKLAKHAAG